MKLICFFTSLIFCVSSASMAEPVRLSKPVFTGKGFEVFGQLIEKPGKLLSLQQLLHNADTHHGTEVYLSTEVGQVCQKKGCFFVAQLGDDTLRITFKDYSFFIPTDANGKTVKVYGRFSRSRLSEQRAKHYAADAGKDPASVKGEQFEYALVASSVSVPTAAITH